MSKELDAILEKLEKLGNLVLYENYKELQVNDTEEFNFIKQALLNKSKKEEAFEEIQAIMDTWHTSNIMDNESALREIDKIIREVFK